MKAVMIVMMIVMTVMMMGDKEREKEGLMDHWDCLMTTFLR